MTLILGASDPEMQAASMGPRLRSRGMDVHRIFEQVRPTASMGPRLRSRGMDDTDDRRDRVTAASMGPRLRSRGMPAMRGSRPWRSACFNGAAA